jgi:hypothetical protein
MTSTLADAVVLARVVLRGSRLRRAERRKPLDDRRSFVVTGRGWRAIDVTYVNSAAELDRYREDDFDGEYVWRLGYDAWGDES